MQNDSSNAVKIRENAEPQKFQKRIGSTVYTVSIHFSRTSTETIEDKILRLIESEAKRIA